MPPPVVSSAGIVVTPVLAILIGAPTRQCRWPRSGLMVEGPRMEPPETSVIAPTAPPPALAVTFSVEPVSAVKPPLKSTSLPPLIRLMAVARSSWRRSPRRCRWGRSGWRRRCRRPVTFEMWLSSACARPAVGAAQRNAAGVILRGQQQVLAVDVERTGGQIEAVDRQGQCGAEGIGGRAGLMVVKLSERTVPPTRLRSWRPVSNRPGLRCADVADAEDASAGNRKLFGAGGGRIDRRSAGVEVGAPTG